MNEESFDISIRRVNQILKTVFELLWFAPDGLYVSEIVKYLKDAIPFTEFELESYPFASQMPRFEAIIRIGTIPFMKVGWLEKTKTGRWFITPIGRKACQENKDTNQFFELSVKVFEDWKHQENRKLALFDADPFSNAAEFSWSQIRQYMEILEIGDLRILVTSLLKALGCYVIWSPAINDSDGSVDMICATDLLGLKPPKIAVHIEKCSNTLSLDDVKNFQQNLQPSDTGIIFSFGDYANGLNEYCIEARSPAIRLIDLDRFIDLWVQNLGKIDQVGYAKLPLQPIHFLSLNRNIK